MALEGYKILSADDHVFEPSDLWVTRMDAKYRDRAPHLVHRETADTWVCDDLIIVGGLGQGTHPGSRFEEDPEKKAEMKARTREEHIRPGGYDPHERIKDMEIDGIEKTIIYPTVGMTLYKVPDSRWLTQMQKTYNDWIAEYCNAVPDRLYGLALTNTDDLDDAVRELYRCKKMGLVGALISVYPGPEKRYFNPEYEPFWTAAEELQLPIALHIGTNRPGPDNEFLPRERSFSSSAFLTNIDHYVRMSIADMIFTGVFERHPNLYVGSIEQETAWVPHFLERMDYTYFERGSELPAEQQPPGPGSRRDRYRFKEGKKPSDFWYSNCFVVFQQDPFTMKFRDFIGVDNIQFGSDYPHDEGTFPKSREVAERVLGDSTPEEKHKVLWGNAARVYNIN